jgi:hypothetical protein
MTTSASNLPPVCVEVGLDCYTCTASTARELAKACPGLPGKLVAQLFVQIHTHPACARMHRNFAQAYDETMQPARPLPKGPGIETQHPLVAAAAAA